MNVCVLSSKASRSLFWSGSLFFFGLACDVEKPAPGDFYRRQSLASFNNYFPYHVPVEDMNQLTL